MGFIMRNIPHCFGDIFYNPFELKAAMYTAQEKSENGMILKLILINRHRGSILLIQNV